MEEVIGLPWRAIGRPIAALVSLAVAFNANAGAEGDAPLPKGMQRYIIPMKGCAIEFMAKTGGYTDVIEPDPTIAGYFHHDNYYPKDRYARHLSFSISCYRGAAKEVCPRKMSELRETDPTMIRDTQQRNLKNLNPRYYTDAFIGTETGVSTPRSRDMELCLGDEMQTIVTGRGIRLGYDPREIVEARGKPVLKQSEKALPDVLAIIRSMRFVPDPPTVESVQPR